MTDLGGYAKTLALPAGFDAPRLLRYDDVTAHAITRDDLGADVRGINASLDLIRETRGGTWPPGRLRIRSRDGRTLKTLEFGTIAQLCHTPGKGSPLEAAYSF